MNRNPSQNYLRGLQNYFYSVDAFELRSPHTALVFNPDSIETVIIIITNFVILFVYIRKYLLATILFCKFELYILPTQG